jgi:two-component system, sensor histidine kinase and response regulator
MSGTELACELVLTIHASSPVPPFNPGLASFWPRCIRQLMFMTRHPNRTDADDFLATMSHELRTPVSAILGMLELALEDTLPASLRENLTTAHESARNLKRLLDDLLEVIRCQAGEEEAVHEPLSLRTTLLRAASALALPGDTKGSRLSVLVRPEVPDAMLGDAARIEQVVVKLAEQAIKCGSSDVATLEVTTTIRDANSVELVMFVTPGLPGAQSAKSPTHNSPTPRAPLSRIGYSSPGLGLNVAEELVKHMQGRAGIDETADHSIRFYCLLRLDLDPNPSQPVLLATSTEGNLIPLASRPVRRPITKTTHPLRILVADDTLANQRVVKSILTKRGHQVELADNGWEAVNSLRRSLFDVVLMDAQMPTMNGLEATEAIRRLDDARRARVRIIAMTAHALPSDRQRCLAAGMDDFLAKPIDVSSLISHVEQTNAESDSTANSGGDGPTTVPLFNQLRALDRLGGDEQLFVELVRLFLQDAPLLLTKIRAALNSQDTEAAALNAHNLRGMAATFDALRTVEAAKQVERLAHAGDFASLPAATETLAEELAAIIDCLSQLDSPAP